MIRTDRMHQWADTQMHAEPIKPLPKGCDYQGRYPQAAEACTEVGADDDQHEGFGAIVVPLFAAPVLLALIAVIAMVTA